MKISLDAAPIMVYALNMEFATLNRNWTPSNVGILLELGFNQPKGAKALLAQYVRESDNTTLTFWANNLIQVGKVSNPSSYLVDTFAAALDLIS